MTATEQALVFATILEGFQRDPGFSWTTEALQEQILTDNGLFLEVDGYPVAFVIWRNLGDEGEILCLATALEGRRRGNMESLLWALFDANGQIDRWWIEVHELNLGALNLYTKIGFLRISERRKYYSDGASALILGKTITP